MKAARGRFPWGTRWHFCGVDRAARPQLDGAQVRALDPRAARRRGDAQGREQLSAARAGVPKNCPSTRTSAPCLVVSSVQTEKSVSGACGANACQAATARGGVRPRPRDLERRHRGDGEGAEAERRDDPEVAAAATAAGPEEVRVLGRRAGADAPRRVDEREPDDAVRGRAVQARAEADAAPEREARDADRGAGAAGDRPSARSRAPCRCRSAGRPRRPSRCRSRAGRRACARRRSRGPLPVE